MSSRVTPEADAVQIVIREYAARGYKIFVEPGPELLPEFLSKFRPDLLAVSDEEKVVVEVMVGRRELSQSDRLEALAERVNNEPGWRFELVVVQPREEVLSDQRVSALVTEGQILARKGIYEGAILLFWAAAEAYLVRIAEDAAIHTSRIDSPAGIVNQLATLGLIERRDYEVLQRMRGLRNSLAHGRMILGEPPDAALLTQFEEVLFRLSRRVSRTT
jgi:hypothetical protein